MPRITVVEVHRRIKDREGCGVSYGTVKRIVDLMEAAGKIQVHRAGAYGLVDQSDIDKIATAVANRKQRTAST